MLNILQRELSALSDHVTWTNPGAGFFTVFTFKTDKVQTDDAFIESLVADHGIVVIPMYDFYPEDAKARNPGAGLDQLRLSFCFSESVGEERRQDLSQAVEAFCTAVKEAIT